MMNSDYNALRDEVLEPTLKKDDLRNISLTLLKYNKTLTDRVTKTRRLYKRQKRCIEQQNKIIDLCESTIYNLILKHKDLEIKYAIDLLKLKTQLKSLHGDINAVIEELKLYDLEDNLGTSHIRLLQKLKTRGRGTTVKKKGASTSGVQRKILSHKKKNGGSSHGKRGRPPKSKTDMEDDQSKKPRGRPSNKEKSVNGAKGIKRKLKQSLDDTVNESQYDESGYERQGPSKKQKKSVEDNESQDDPDTPKKYLKKRKLLDELRKKSKAILHMVHASRANSQRERNAADADRDTADYEISPENYDLLVSKCMEDAGNPKAVVVLQDVLEEPYSGPDCDREVIENYKYSCVEATANEEDNSAKEPTEDVGEVPTAEKENEAEEIYDEYCQLSTTLSPRFEWQGPFPPPDYKPDGGDASE